MATIDALAKHKSTVHELIVYSTNFCVMLNVLERSKIWNVRTKFTYRDAVTLKLAV